MSFYVEFTAASRDDALRIILTEGIVARQRAHIHLPGTGGVPHRSRHLRQGDGASLLQRLRCKQRDNRRARNQASVSKVGTFAARSRFSLWRRWAAAG